MQTHHAKYKWANSYMHSQNMWNSRRFSLYSVTLLTDNHPCRRSINPKLSEICFGSDLQHNLLNSPKERPSNLQFNASFSHILAAGLAVQVKLRAPLHNDRGSRSSVAVASGWQSTLSGVSLFFCLFVFFFPLPTHCELQLPKCEGDGVASPGCLC